MIKKNDFGFKSPVRRSTKNITGHKVGGELSGGDVKIVNSNRINVNKTFELVFPYKVETDIPLFNQPISILAFGGYFLSQENTILKLSIIIDDNKIETTYNLEGGKWYSVGIDQEIDLNNHSITNKTINFVFNISSDLDSYYFDYTNLNYGIIDYEYFKKQNVYSRYSNSKKSICFPEQFYFSSEEYIPNSTSGSIIYKKSCNRCQRFLPINSNNEREQLAFSNHCAAQAPCKHSTFSRYKILENKTNDKELKVLLDNTTYYLSENNLHTHYGHQLECKACKKFFVNSELNSKRTSSQHREDGLRRRAVEILTNILLNRKNIYQDYRIKYKREFDVDIWEKFDRKCFKCKIDIENEEVMHLDHTMPLAYLYPLDEHATCLCATCNNSKSDSFPINFYTNEQLFELSKITGLPIELLNSTESNINIVELLREEKTIVWFFEKFLTHGEYQKIRDGKKASDSILKSIQKVINNSPKKFNIHFEYLNIKKKEEEELDKN